MNDKPTFFSRNLYKLYSEDYTKVYIIVKLYF